MVQQSFQGYGIHMATILIAGEYFASIWPHRRMVQTTLQQFINENICLTSQQYFCLSLTLHVAEGKASKQASGSKDGSAK
mmetsp:Transcript_71934/g.120668  ORF Transcript_71934/g.120668 Transcript_71934/m.120668 type:complete len:80 (-) Transcript_71934:2398-2637(-)